MQVVRFLSSFALTAGLMLAGAHLQDVEAAETAMTDLARLNSGYSFGETVERLRLALEGAGFTIFTVIDQAEAARSVGLNMPPTTLLVYGNPRGGTPAMLAAPDFGIELPLKVLVRKDQEGRVLVVYVPATSFEGRHGLPAGLAAKLGGAEPLIAAAVNAKAK